MEMFRILTGGSGRSRIEDIKPPFTEGPAQPDPRFIKATSVRFTCTVGEQMRDWHNPAQKVLVAVLSGRMEVQSGDGNVKTNLAPGDFFLAADLAGQGHQSRSRGDCRRMIVAMPDWEAEPGVSSLPAIPRIPPGLKMRGNVVLRIYTGPDNKTHFQDLPNFTLDDKLTLPVTGINFRRTEGETFSDWHNAPRRQLLLTCSGELEIEIGSGEKRVLSAGDLLVAEDLTGQGHVTRGRGDRRTLTIPLAAEAKLPT